jgi:2-keto-4-pentenoate hydratase/2-oxohepta-3-ene-1,7-dioic acid hydratase in catechol pathway
MRIVRYQIDTELPRYGWINHDKVGNIEGDIYAEYRRLKAQIPLEDVRLLAPAEPGKIICVGRNYAEHAKEMGNELPKVPLIFMKPPSAIINPGEAIVLPPQSQQVEHEAELVAVIGRRGRNVTAEQARHHILGYTIGNDITARDLQKSDGQWTRAKGFDGFGPFGPFIATAVNPATLTVRTLVNGKERQNYPVRDMIFSPEQLVSLISRDLSLFPGDIISCGTSVGAGSLPNGATVDVVIDGVGTLSNRYA